MRLEGERLDGLLQAAPQVELGAVEIELARLDFREVQNVVDDGHQGIRRTLDHAQVLALLGREFGIESELRHADDAVHGRANLVAHIGEKGALGLAGGFRSLLGPPQLRFGLLALIDVERGLAFEPAPDDFHLPRQAPD